MARCHSLAQLFHPRFKVDVLPFFCFLLAHLAIVHVPEANDAGLADTVLWITAQTVIVDDESLPLCDGLQQAQIHGLVADLPGTVGDGDDVQLEVEPKVFLRPTPLMMPSRS